MITPDLFEYGIFTEKSDIRAHVGVIAKTVFVFRTSDAVTEIERQSGLEERDAWQPGVDYRTARGILLPLEKLKTLRKIPCLAWPQFHGWTKDLSTSEKGRRAVEIVLGLLKRGFFPLWIDASEDDRTNIQVSGTDILIVAKQKIQVKCDFSAGPKNIAGCTGNLFIQTKELNPLQRH